ncbi:MAG: dTDP-4-dehydrorhamnose reductase [Gemmatimonadales bacterium]|nr:dTDP-4-dehydrorhamnose reductase [Gemmatimonadales bacterium]
MNVGKALITGAGGQLGIELRATAPPGWLVTACDSRELDVTRTEVVSEVLEREAPSVVLNAAAFTSVDAAEDEPARAEAVNVRGAANVAEAARRIGARMIHLSTDFVFDGAQGRPYTPSDPPRPLGVYARTKLAGEREVERVSRGEALVIRTAWVYSAHGRNFVRTMLGLMQERESLGVVADQIGTPTWARPLAEALWRAAALPALRGIHHWTDAGVATWYDFAEAIQEEALGAGLLTRRVAIRPLRTGEYPAKARRPSFSVLDKTATWAVLGGPARHWRANLRLMLGGLANA